MSPQRFCLKTFALTNDTDISHRTWSTWYLSSKSDVWFANHIATITASKKKATFFTHKSFENQFTESFHFGQMLKTIEMKSVDPEELFVSSKLLFRSQLLRFLCLSILNLDWMSLSCHYCTTKPVRVHFLHGDGESSSPSSHVIYPLPLTFPSLDKPLSSKRGLYWYHHQQIIFKYADILRD